MEQQSQPDNAVDHSTPNAESWLGFWVSLITTVALVAFLVWSRPHMPPHIELLRIVWAMVTGMCFLRTIAELAVIRDARRARAMNTSAQ